MRYFLVDTENISKYDFIQEYDLTNEDTLVMFVSEKSQNISVKDANIEIIKTVCNEIAFDIDNLDIEKELDEATKEVINNSGTLSELHNNLRALHGNEKGRELYLKVKKSLESKSVK